jgi:hypothetical protein
MYKTYNLYFLHFRIRILALKYTNITIPLLNLGPCCVFWWLRWLLFSFVDPDPYFFKCTQDCLEAYIVKVRFSTTFLVTVKNPSWKFRNIFMKARTLSSIFLNFSVLSHWFLNIHLYRAFSSKLPHIFFTVYTVKNNKTVKTIVCFSFLRASGSTKLKKKVIIIIKIRNMDPNLIEKS